MQPMEVAIRQMNEMGIFCVFVILDSLSKVGEYSPLAIKHRYMCFFRILLLISKFPRLLLER